MKSKYLSISWTKYCEYARKLAEAIIQSDPHETQIVSIARGGIVLGRLLSDYLQIPISTITIQSYKDFTTQGEVSITEHLRTDIKNKAILLVDDKADSGVTFKRAVGYLKRFKPKSITTISLYCTKNSIFRPDFFAAMTSQWIIFPYEVAETILHITKVMKEKQKTKLEIQTALEKLGFSDEEICFVRKFYLS